jgi:hypothetical protein
VLSKAFISETILTLMLHCLNSSLLILIGFTRAPLNMFAFSNWLNRQMTLLMLCSLVKVQELVYDIAVSRITRVDFMASVTALFHLFRMIQSCITA